MNYPIYYPDCRHFRGDLPCKPHKEKGIHCENCSDYIKTDGNVLIIKLGAGGDVIRTTPLLHRINKEYPTKLIWWLTNFPDLVPKKVDKILDFSLESLTIINEINFDLIINLDKDYYACALAKRLSAKEKFGYTLKDGKPAPFNHLAEYKFLTGLFDDISKANTKSYLDEIFEICGWKFSGEEYIIDFENYDWKIANNGKRIVGLNTGCGSRWSTRLWKNEYWIELAEMLKSDGYYPILLGGEPEHDKNLTISRESGIFYPGHFSLSEFISLVNQCELIVTAVTMTLHIAIALKKPVVLMNNIFNKNEFELYGRGVIVEPEKQCQCYFSPICHNERYFCMDTLYPEKVFEAVKSLLNYAYSLNE